MLESTAPRRADARAISNARLALLSPERLEQFREPPRTFRPGSVLRDAADRSKVFFIDEGLVGLQVSVGNGRRVEAVALGRDAVVGAEVLFGQDLELPTLAMAYTPVVARALSGDLVREAVESSPVFRRELFRAFGEVQASAMRRVACAQFHTVNERVARWLLIARAEIGDSIPLAHAVIADALGCRRSGVTVAMQGLRTAGLVSYTRGTIRVVDAPGLANEACGCEPARRTRDAFRPTLAS